MTKSETLAFEIGTEEIPAFDLDRATTQLAKLVPELLGEARIPHGAVEVFSSPRRLIVVVADVAESTEAICEEHRGPSTKIAFDENGNPTKAAIGFARGKGLEPSDLTIRAIDGVEYVFALRQVPAIEVTQLLPEVLKNVIISLNWPKSCRWGTRTEYFSRPIRWLLALLGDKIVPLEFAGLSSDRLTWGHRVLAAGPHTVAHAEALIDTLRNAAVIPDQQEREDRIRAGVAAIEKKTGARAELPAKTLLEVTNLCEFPSVLLGSFDEEFLRVPEEIIVDAMLMHQRYFPLYNADGALVNNFIVVSNGAPDAADTIIAGNERVVRARLSDAKFFYDEDLKHPLEDYVTRLDTVVFQEQLGTVKTKTERLVEIAEAMSTAASCSDEDRKDALRAAYLCKADLVTNAVIEFTSAQGIMGSYYALAAGENERVAAAIADHYKPRFSGDEPPVSRVGKIVACADKLDTICGLFALGQGPTGSSDPFALRRSALGVLSILSDHAPGETLQIALVPAIEATLRAYQSRGLNFDFDAVRNAVIDFFITRATVALRDDGNGSDTIEAVLAVGVEEPIECMRRVRALEQARRHDPEVFDNLATAYARACNLSDESCGTNFDEGLLSEVEHELAGAIIQAEARVGRALEVDDYSMALSDLAQLRKPIDLFFERIMVMDEDERLRTNRLRILNRFVAVFKNIADFSKMVKN